jgi:hypothetical protein
MLNAIRKRLPLTFAVLTLLGSATPAFADSSYCWYSYVKFLEKSCDTGTVAANSRWHTIYVEASSFAHYEVIDTTLPGRVVINSGTAGGNGRHTTLGGVYARYRVHVEGPFVAWGYINNN